MDFFNKASRLFITDNNGKIMKELLTNNFAAEITTSWKRFCITAHVISKITIKKNYDEIDTIYQNMLIHSLDFINLNIINCFNLFLA
jgi:hypothetical protein